MDFTHSSQQRRAIEAPLGPVLVIAGPGAGKTACLIGRVRHLVEKLGMQPDHICAVTFTNKAAEEIATRLADSLGEDAASVKRSTIHALCAEVLRDHAEAAGLRPGFGIADDEYQRTVLAQMRQGPRTGDLLKLFGRRRLSGYQLTPGDEKLYAEYARTLRRRNVVDFDDLLVLTVRLFADRADVADAVAARFTYVLVDEFQDINDAQYTILRRLAEPHGNLFAVGDDEQSIFSWAGANPRVLARFQADTGVQGPIVLDENHRCSQQIFAAARRLLSLNPSLFDKDLRARRLSVFPVRAIAFPDDEVEAQWILRDIEADRAGHGLEWGDYAVLYRRHEIGDRLEARFLKAGVPCRLAKGRPLSEDAVIGYVITALNLIQRPFDGAAAEAFAGRVLPEHVMQRVKAEMVEENATLLGVLRDVAGGMSGDPDAKKLWRLVYQVENLAAMKTRHETLRALVDDLLSQRVGRYRNVLEDRHEDLSDPADDPAAAALAARLLAARTAKSRIVLERMSGLEFGVRGMLFASGLRLVAYADEVEQAELDDLRLGEADGGAAGLALTAFKALQLLHTRGLEGAPERYVTFDLETTDLDIDACEIVEIGAAKVEHGVVVAEFHELVRPERAIAPGAERVHGYGASALADKPGFNEVWPRFEAFVEGLTLVAHNGFDFDVPVLRRMAAPLGGADHLRVFDTLPLARSLSDSAKLENLAARFGLPAGRAHHALDDARTLAGVYEELERRRAARARKSALVNVLAWLGLSLALEQKQESSEETKLLFGIASAHALGRYSDCLEFYDAERRRTGLPSPTLDTVIEWLGGRKKMERMREEVDAARRYPEAIARLEALIEQGEGEGVDVAIGRFLERVALSTSHGADIEKHRVNLLTLHSTKGLEFPRVYIVGVEDEQMPGWTRPDEDADHAVQEARRLLYVGMTRARERLILTRVERRHGKPGGGSRFLDEMALPVEQPGSV